MKFSIVDVLRAEMKFMIWMFLYTETETETGIELNI